MKLFLSAVENRDQRNAISQILASSTKSTPLLWNLMSYYYLRNDMRWAERVRDCSRAVMVDSGAHSFQKGTKVSWDEYTHEYASFIAEFDRDGVVGYFEMDVDNIIGYEEVLRLRGVLERESGHPDKIIPVWHKNRGIGEYKRMCETHSGQTVAITGFKNEDIRDEQYPMFLKYAWDCGCKVHCLGMARKKVLDSVPFDYCDASSWAQQAIRGKAGGYQASKGFSKTNRDKVFVAAYEEGMRQQLHYWRRWRKVCHDEF